MGRRDEKDLAMIGNEDSWPVWPRLPLKNVLKKATAGSWPLFGFMVAGPRDGTKVKVYLTTLYDNSDLKNVTVQTYDSPEAMLADGWEVD